MTKRQTAIYFAKEAYNLWTTCAVKTKGFTYLDIEDQYLFNCDNGVDVLLKPNGSLLKTTNA